MCQAETCACCCVLLYSTPAACAHRQTCVPAPCCAAALKHPPPHTSTHIHTTMHNNHRRGRGGSATAGCTQANTVVVWVDTHACQAVDKAHGVPLHTKHTRCRQAIDNHEHINHQAKACLGFCQHHTVLCQQVPRYIVRLCDRGCSSECCAGGSSVGAACTALHSPECGCYVGRRKKNMQRMW